MESTQKKIDIIKQIAADIELPIDSVFNLVILCLEQARIEKLNDPSMLNEYLHREDGLKRYWEWVERKTKRQWEYEEMMMLWKIVKCLNTKHVRDPIQPIERLYLLLNKTYKCFKCNKRNIKLEIHHKIPVSKGGINNIDNYEWCCPTCNKILGNKYNWK